jgi:hypothetical protein
MYCKLRGTENTEVSNNRKKKTYKGRGSYTVKKRLAVFHITSRDVTFQTLPGRELLNYLLLLLFLARRPSKIFDIMMEILSQCLHFFNYIYGTLYNSK